MNNRIIAVVVVAILVVAGVGVYVATSSHDNGDKTVPDTAGEVIIDGAGRSVTVPDSLKDGIVTIGSSGPLRFLSMFDVADMVIETDKGDVTDNKNGRAYSYAYPYDQLKSYHPDNALEAAEAERIGNLEPSLVIVQLNVYQNYKENFDTLEKRTTILVLEAQQMAYMTDSNNDLASYMKNNINMIGTILGQEDRAKEVISGIESILDDIASLSKTSDDRVYVAGVTISGSNILNTTFPIYMPFSLTGVKNAYDGTSTASKVVLNIETLSKMTIDKIIIDPSSSDKVKEKDSQLVLEYVYGINNDADTTNDIPMYVTVPIVWDSINYDCALASAYYVESLVYGSLTVSEVEKKINNIFTTFYGDNGKNVFDDMKAFFVEKSSSNGVEFPVLGEVKIVKSGDQYTLVSA